MTIDSDSDNNHVEKETPKQTPNNKKNAKQAKKAAKVEQAIVPAEEEGDIQVSKEFQMDGIIEMGYQKKQSVNTEAKYENKTLWSYADAYKTDHRNQEDPNAASTVLSLDERIQIKLAEFDIDVEAQLGVSNQNPEEEKVQREKEKAQL